MIIKEEYTITPELFQDVLNYAQQARAFATNRHDFHADGLDNKQQKMLEGKLDEKGFKCSWLKIIFLLSKIILHHKKKMNLIFYWEQHAKIFYRCENSYKTFPYSYTGDSWTS